VEAVRQKVITIPGSYEIDDGAVSRLVKLIYNIAAGAVQTLNKSRRQLPKIVTLSWMGFVDGLKHPIVPLRRAQ